MAKKSMKELDEEIGKLDLSGRDEFHTHLIKQEIPSWVDSVYEGKEDLILNEAKAMAERRGFNLSEKRKFFRLARWIASHAKDLRACRPASSKHRVYMRGWEDGARKLPPQKKDSLYLSGFCAGKAARKLAAGKFAGQIGYAVPVEHKARKYSAVSKQC